MTFEFTLGQKITSKGVVRSVDNFDQFWDFVSKQRSKIAFDGTEDKAAYDHKKDQLPWIASLMRGGRLAENVLSRSFLWFDVDGCCDVAYGILQRILNDCIEGLTWTTPGNQHPLKGAELPHRLRIVLAITRPLQPHEIEPLHLLIEGQLRDLMNLNDEAGAGFTIKFDRSVYLPHQVIFLPDANAELHRLHGEPVNPDDYADALASVPFESSDAWDIMESAGSAEEMEENGVDILCECEKVMMEPAFLALGVDRTDWIRQIARLAAFKGTTWEELAFSLASRWSKTACPEKYDHADFMARWEQLGDRSTPFAIFKEARALGIDAPTRFDHLADDESLFDEEPPAAPQPVDLKGWFTFNDAPFSQYEAPRYIIDRMIPQGVTMVVGKSGSFKSYFVLAMACSIASARTFATRNLNTGNVVYVAAEGAAGIRQRVNAWRHHYNVGALTKLHVAPLRVDLFDRDKRNAFLRQLDALHSNEPLRMIVLDTFSALYTGDSDNDSAQVSRFLNLCDRIAQRYGCAVVFVHHPGKKGNDARGSGVFLNNTDCVLTVSRNNDYMQLTVTKQKYGEADPDAMFHVPSSQLPDHYIDRILADMEPYSTGMDGIERANFTERVFIDVPEDTNEPDPTEQRQRKISRMESDGADLIVLLENAAAEMTEQQLRDAWYDRTDLERTGATRRRFKEALTWAISGNHINEADGKMSAVQLF